MRNFRILRYQTFHRGDISATVIDFDIRQQNRFSRARVSLPLRRIGKQKHRVGLFAGVENPRREILP